MAHPWISDRTEKFDSSGIRAVFDLARKLKNPINLSIGQPDFDVPQSIKNTMIEAVKEGKNGYAPTEGLPILRERLQANVDAQLGHADRQVFVCSGTSGGLALAVMTLVNPGDEVIVFDPCFVMYESLIHLAGGIPVPVNTYPDFQIDVNKVEDALTGRTKMIIVNSPANPTGVQLDRQTLRDLAALAQRHELALVSDEIYREYCYDDEFTSPAEFNDQTVVIDGFSKTYGMTGWRLGFVHGPAEIMDSMIKIQQYSFVCAPQPVQWAGVAALDVDMTQYVDAYRRKRDLIVNGLAGHYDLVRPSGAFYAFPKLPWGTGQEFISRAVEAGLLIIPGNIFSHHDTHFRISYAADDQTLQRGIEALVEIAKP